MHEYRDQDEFYDKCYYCTCRDCGNWRCKMSGCEFCEGGECGTRTESKCKDFIKDLNS